jgi:threonylcarbamoyladenosine tRNA methylthiotransferase MtaB
MPQVPRAVIRERAARLREAGAAALARALAGRIGRVAQVLIERPGFGRSEHWAPVRFSGEAAVGSVAAFKLVAAGAEAIEGALL